MKHISARADKCTNRHTECNEHHHPPALVNLGYLIPIPRVPAQMAYPIAQMIKKAEKPAQHKYFADQRIQ